MFNIDTLVKSLTDKGYTIFTKGFYNLNLIYVRSEYKPDEFNCSSIVFYKTPNSRDNWVYNLFTVTTYPGVFYIDNPMLPEGCAVISEGQHNQCWQLGYHYNIKALVNINSSKPISWVRVPRGSRYNYDILKTLPQYSGAVGLNAHPVMDGNNDTIGADSAGCIVYKYLSEFNLFMSLCDAQVVFLKSKVFTPTFINYKDLLNVGVRI